jgi:hypothetical protein
MIGDPPPGVRAAPDERPGPLRQVLLALIAVGVLGTFAELWLLEHYEEAWQLTPLILLALAVPMVALCALRPSPVALRAFQLLMAAFVLGGMMGIYQHYSGNVEFELEMYPTRAGLELFWESLKGATPALAPGSLSWLGLLGLAYTWRHPRLSKDPLQKPPRGT